MQQYTSHYFSIILISCLSFTCFSFISARNDSNITQNKFAIGTEAPMMQSDTSILEFHCPKDTTISNSLSPDSTGYPIVIDMDLLDSLYYTDSANQLSCIDTNAVFWRNWTLKDTSGNSYFCTQKIIVLRDYSKILLPKDTILRHCSGVLKAGVPTYLGLELSSNEDVLGLSFFFMDNRLSPSQIKRDFYVFDLCSSLDYRALGHQLITLTFDSLPNQPLWCIIELQHKDTAIIRTGTTRTMYYNIEDCRGNLANTTVQFMDDGLAKDYQDDFARNDTIELQTIDKFLYIKFSEFNLAIGDTLYAYIGSIPMLKQDPSPQFLKASGNGVGQAFGSSIKANLGYNSDVSDYITFILKTNGDRRSGSGWNASWNCSKIICPDSAQAFKSILPEVLGVPIIVDSTMMSTLLYEDKLLDCIDGDILVINRHWKFYDYYRDLTECIQTIHWHRSIDNFQLPKDTAIHKCDFLKYSDDLTKTGQVFIADIPIPVNKKSYEYELRYQDELISRFKIKRHFSILDYCKPEEGFKNIGHQIIHIIPSNDGCIMEINRGDIITMDYHPLCKRLGRYEYQSGCSDVTIGNSSKFMDDELLTTNYHDSIPRSDTIEICAMRRAIRIIFSDFDLSEGDTLLAYRGNLDSLRKVNNPTLLKASGNGISKAFGGWLDAHEYPSQNPSGCLTFIFKTNGDGLSDTGWESYWDCEDLVCPPDKTTETSLSPEVTGYPTVYAQPNIIDTIFYRDSRTDIICIDNTTNITRTWELHYLSGDIQRCQQYLTLTKRDIYDVKIPSDIVLNECLNQSDLEDWNITGTPTIYDTPFTKDEYNLLFMFIYLKDSIISNSQIKRKFNVLDWCNAQLIPIGHQLITFPPNGDTDNDAVLDCEDLCQGGDDRINSDGLGMPDDCDCDPNDPADEYIEVEAFSTPTYEIIDTSFHASFQLKSASKFKHGGNITFYAGNNILLEAGFAIPKYSNFMAQIDPDCSKKNQEHHAFNKLPFDPAIPKGKPSILNMRVMPNPFSANTTIDYELSQKSFVRLTLYNLWGKEIQILEQKILAKGSYQTTLSSKKLPKGTYFLTLQSEIGVLTKKILVLD